MPFRPIGYSAHLSNLEIKNIITPFYINDQIMQNCKHLVLKGSDEHCFVHSIRRPFLNFPTLYSIAL